MRHFTLSPSRLLEAFFFVQQWLIAHFISILQLRKQFWIFTKFPIKPTWHLYPAIHIHLD